VFPAPRTLFLNVQLIRRSGNEEEKRRLESGEKGRTIPAFKLDWLRTPEEVKVCDGLELLAKEIGAKNIGAGEFHYWYHK